MANLANACVRVRAKVSIRIEIKIPMQQKMTITIDREVYDALYRVVGKGNISKFLENLARPHVMKEDLTSAYQAMAADTEREREALEWSNGLIGSVNDA
jgi:predicted CopG family antitoxin